MCVCVCARVPTHPVCVWGIYTHIKTKKYLHIMPFVGVTHSHTYTHKNTLLVFQYSTAIVTSSCFNSEWQYSLSLSISKIPVACYIPTYHESLECTYIAYTLCKYVRTCMRTAKVHSVCVQHMFYKQEHMHINNSVMM